MPGKVNPVLCEAVCQVVAQVVGNDAAVAWSGAAGNFELNVMLPVIARNLLESIRLLANVSRVFADRCISGITANEERCREYAESSPSIVTPLNHYVGYDEAAKIAKQSLAERKTIREVVIERGHVPGALSEQQLDEVLDVLSMTRPKSSRPPAATDPAEEVDPEPEHRQDDQRRSPPAQPRTQSSRVGDVEPLTAGDRRGGDGLGVGHRVGIAAKDELPVLRDDRDNSVRHQAAAVAEPVGRDVAGPQGAGIGRPLDHDRPDRQCRRHAAGLDRQRLPADQLRKHHEHRDRTAEHTEQGPRGYLDEHR